MRWNEYQQQALTTAIFPLDRSIEYTVFGLASEVGEVGLAFLQLKTGYGDTSGNREEVISELGDCYWYVAAIADACGSTLEGIARYRADVTFFPSTFINDFLKLVGESSNMAGVVKKAIRDNEGFITEADRHKIANSLFASICFLDDLCAHLETNRHSVMAANLNKLADRKQRGVLQGSGDHR